VSACCDKQFTVHLHIHVSLVSALLTIDEGSNFGQPLITISRLRKQKGEKFVEFLLFIFTCPHKKGSRFELMTLVSLCTVLID